MTICQYMMITNSTWTGDRLQSLRKSPYRRHTLVEREITPVVQLAQHHCLKIPLTVIYIQRKKYGRNYFPLQNTETVNEEVRDFPI